MKILVINGPNLNLLGVREPDHYGKESYASLCERIEAHCKSRGVTVKVFQSNHEGAIVDEIQAAMGVYDGIVMNPAAYTHTSIAIPDALRAVKLPCVEIHISDVNSREEYRRISYVRPACIGAVVGHGTDGYLEAIDLLCRHLEEQA
jgi:3-dehydroquinate dehydratase-2